MRSPLKPWEDRLIDRFGELLTTEHHPASRTSKRLVRRCGHNVETKIEGIVHCITSDQPSKMRRIRHRDCANFVSNGFERRVINISRVRRVSAEHHLGLIRDGVFAYLIKINRPIGRICHVSDEVKQPPHMGHGSAVGEVTPMGQIHGHDGVTGFEQTQINGLIHPRTRQRLDVRMLASKHFLCTIAS